MKYLVCYVWNNTRGNHAGMAHMCDLLKEKWPKEYKVIKFYQERDFNIWPSKKLNRYTRELLKFILDKIAWLKVSRMINNISDQDKVFLLEYLVPDLEDMRVIASTIKKKNKITKVLALSHLTPSRLDSLFAMDDKKMAEWSNEVDAMLTLGSSLSNYFIQHGVEKRKVYTLFHYVDLQYYQSTFQKHNEVRVLLQGNLQRNFELIEKIIQQCPDVRFVMCSGVLSLDQFKKYSNVDLYGFIEESNLRQLMDDSDISLNVMEDTVGSNVIVTSMAMGLAMVVSDVGSIHDYCDEGNAIFCKTENDFITQIHTLSNDKDKIKEMRLNSINKSKSLSIDRFHQILCGL